MLNVSSLVPWAPRFVSRLVIWFAWVHSAFWGFTCTRSLTCWPALGSETSAEKTIWLFVHPSNCVGSTADWSADSARLPDCPTLVGGLGGNPKSGGVNSSF